MPVEEIVTLIVVILPAVNVAVGVNAYSLPSIVKVTELFPKSSGNTSKGLSIGLGLVVIDVEVVILKSPGVSVELNFPSLRFIIPTVLACTFIAVKLLALEPSASFYCKL